MKISGFTFIRNAVQYDYPIVESIQSILPLVDEMVVALGNSEDDTNDLVKSINSPKLKFIHTTWDDSLREGGIVLARETDKALQAVAKDSDWAFYLQGDEVIHEKDLPVLKSAMEKYLNNKKVEGLLLNYLHFYGSFDYIGSARNWYRHEIRIIRPNLGIKSFRDAQGFRINNHKLKVMSVPASVYHYGWVKAPEFQQQKIRSFNKLWHSDQWVDENIPPVNEFDYSNIRELQHFDGSHPKVMQTRISRMNWKFDFDPTAHKLGFKNTFLQKIEKATSWRIGEYKNYTLLKEKA
ncbi:MAG: hypothetical protein RRX93_05615 [Bacteroidales bacterium]